jgi:hypothetical protein
VPQREYERSAESPKPSRRVHTNSYKLVVQMRIEAKEFEQRQRTKAKHRNITHEHSDQRPKIDSKEESGESMKAI